MKTLRSNHSRVRSQTARAESVCRVGTYREEPCLAAGLAAGRNAQLLFSGWVSQGREEAELLEYYIAGSDCGKFDVLWLRSDWCEGLSARAWSPRGGLPGKKMWEALLMAYWKAEKAAQEMESLPFSEVAKDSGVMAPEKVWKIVQKIWPEIVLAAA